MTSRQAGTAANAIMAAAALGAAVIVLRRATLRRLAWRLTRTYVAGPMAAWGATTVRDAWQASGRRRVS
jgi:hypothetical protein